MNDQSSSSELLRTETTPTPGLTPPRRPLTETERNWLSAALIVVGSLALFGGIYAFEMNLGRWRPDIRIVPDASEAAARYVSISHFLVAFLFMSTSRRMRSLRSWVLFAVMLGVGTVLCAGYAQLRTMTPLLASFLFFLYFAAHDFRDQVFFYFANGDSPLGGDRKALARTLVWIPFLLIGAVLALGAALTSFGILGIAPVQRALAGLAKPARAALGVLPLLAFLAAASVWKRGWNRENFGPLATFLRAHRPIQTVFAGTFLLLIAGTALAGLPYTIVILHVAAWYVFTIRQLGKRPPGAAVPPRFSWQWFRGTRAGFNLLHLGSAALLLVVGVVWAYRFQNNPELTPVWVALDPGNFRYWTILHITVSFPGR